MTTQADPKTGIVHLHRRPLDETLAYLAQQVTKADAQARALKDAANVLATTEGMTAPYPITSSLPPCPKCEALVDALGDIDHEESAPVDRMDKLLQAAQEGSQAAVENARLGRELKDAQDLIHEVWGVLGYQPGSGKALADIIKSLQGSQTEHDLMLHALPKDILAKHGGRPIAEIVAILVKEWSDMERHAGDWEQVAQVRALVPARFIGDGVALKDGVRAMAKALEDATDDLRDIAHMMPDEVLAAFGPEGPSKVYDAVVKLVQLFVQVATERDGWREKAHAWAQLMEYVSHREDVSAGVPAGEEAIRIMKALDASITKLRADWGEAIKQIPEGMRIDDDLLASVGHLADMYEAINKHADVLTNQVADLRQAVKDLGKKDTVDLVPDVVPPTAPAPAAKRKVVKPAGRYGNIIRKVKAGWAYKGIARYLGCTVTEVIDAVAQAKADGLLDAPPAAGNATVRVEAAKAKADQIVVDDPSVHMAEGKEQEVVSSVKGILAKLPSLEEFTTKTGKAAPKPEDYQATIPIPELAGKDAFAEKVEKALAPGTVSRPSTTVAEPEPAPRALEGGTTEQPIQEPGNAATQGLRASSTEELKAEVARQQGGNKQRQARLATTDNRKHSHEVIVDFFGDGHTVADKTGHVHRVLRFSVGNAHGHGHDLAVRS